MALLPRDWVAERLGNAAPTTISDRFWLNSSLAELGRFPEAFQYGAEAARIAEVTRHPYTIGLAQFSTGILHVYKGDWVKGRSIIEQVTAIYRAANIGVFRQDLACASALTLARLGETDQALDRIHEAQQILDGLITRGMSGRTGPAYGRLGGASVLLGRLDEARSMADRSIEFTQRHLGAMAHALHLLGEIASHPDCFDAESGETNYRKALSLAEPRGMRPLVAHCHLGLGKLYARTGKRHEALEQLSTAVTMYRGMEMQFWLPETEAEIAQLR